jgi:hypothetical protein
MVRYGRESPASIGFLKNLKNLKANLEESLMIFG